MAEGGGVRRSRPTPSVRPPWRTQWTAKASVLLFGCALALGIGEAALRTALACKAPVFDGLRNPARYADYFSQDDYWKLYVRFGGAYTPPHSPHPLLGWTGRFSPDTYRHDDAVDPERRPVLLYGDSFARGVPQSERLENILDARSSFAERYQLLNYGVAGYGLDQISLLLEQSIDLYPEAFVVFSLMTLDLDRTLLTLRPGRKPYFLLENGALVLSGVPIEGDFESRLAQQPVGIRSFLFRRFVYAKQLPLPLAQWLRHEGDLQDRKRRLCDALLERVLRTLRERERDFVFLVFHPHVLGVSELNGPDDWRDEFLREFLDRHGVPYVWSKDLVRRAVRSEAADPSEYILPGDGHPTTRFYRLVAAALAEHLEAR